MKKYSYIVKWWCELNAWKVPRGITGIDPRDSGQVSAAWNIVEEIVHREGLEKEVNDLWAEKYNPRKKIKKKSK